MFVDVPFPKLQFQVSGCERFQLNESILVNIGVFPNALPHILVLEGGATLLIAARRDETTHVVPNMLG